MKYRIKKIIRWVLVGIYRSLTEIFNNIIFVFTSIFPKLSASNVWKWSLVTIKSIDFFQEYELQKLKSFQIEYISSSPKYFDDYKDEKQYYKLSESYAYIALNATVRSNSSLIIIDDEFAIYKPIHISNNNYKLTDGSILGYKNQKCIISSNKKKIHIKEGINFVINYSFNYYHVLFELIPKFYYLKQMNINDEIPIIADSKIKDIPNFDFLLKLFSGQREIIYINKSEQITVDKLYIIPEATIIPPNFIDITLIKRNDFLFDLEAIEWIREKLLEKTTANLYSKRIFLSRQNATYRRKCNEGEVFELLRKYDFEKVYPEKMTISEQVSVFNSAEFIVGVSGAAFSNLLFCSKGCNVICLTNYKLNISIFSSIANNLDIDLTYLYDHTKQLNYRCDLHDSFKVDLNSLEELLQSKLIQL